MFAPLKTLRKFSTSLRYFTAASELQPLQAKWWENWLKGLNVTYWKNPSRGWRGCYCWFNVDDLLFLCFIQTTMLWKLKLSGRRNLKMKVYNLILETFSSDAFLSVWKAKYGHVNYLRASAIENLFLLPAK